MATEIRHWQSSNGRLFVTREEAEHEDFICEVADVLDAAGNKEFEFDAEEAVKGLLKKYKLEKLEPAK